MKASPDDRVEVLVSVDDKHIGEIKRIADDLARLGMDVDRLLGAIGVISGRVEKTKLRNLEGVPGVAEVEIAEQFQLPPPDSPIQ
jgi:hypothetical protein